MKLAIQHLRKVYQDGKVALADFNLELDRGVFGLLGPNGAGKSTLLEILALDLQPTSGQLLCNGWDIQKRPNEFRKILGYLPQTYGFYPDLPAQVLLDYLGKLHGLHGKALRRRVGETLDLVGLTPFRKRKVGTFSGGMRQRMAIAQAMLHDPELLVIDEPTTHLDPEERVAFRNLLFDLGEKHIVFLSTHIVKDVAFSCQGMTLLYGGEQQFTGQPSDFLRRVEGRVFEAVMPFAGFDAFSQTRHVVAIHEQGETIEARFIAAPDETPPPGAIPANPNLEDAYVDFIRERKGETSLAEVA